MKSLDPFLDREYSFDAYNCGHFVAEVWEFITDEDIYEICDAFVQDTRKYISLIKSRTRLIVPESPSVVIMQASNVAPHAGIYYNGRVLHLTEAGPKFDDICVLKAYFRLSYYK